MKCICNEPKAGGLLEQIFAVKPEEWVNPPKLPGTFDVQGPMNDFEKSAYTVFDRLQQMIMAKRALADHGETTQAAAKALKYEILDLMEKASMVQNLIAVSIKDRMNLWGKSFGLSHGYKVALPDEGLCLGIVCGGSLGDVLTSVFEAIEKAAEKAS